MDPITKINQTTLNNQLNKNIDTYKTYNIRPSIVMEEYKPLEEVISVRELLRRLADGKIVLDTKVKI